MTASPIRYFTENNRWVPLTLYSHRCYGEQTRKYSRRCLSITVIMNQIFVPDSGKITAFLDLRNLRFK